MGVTQIHGVCLSDNITSGEEKGQSVRGRDLQRGVSLQINLEKDSVVGEGKTLYITLLLTRSKYKNSGSEKNKTSERVSGVNLNPTKNFR